MIVLELFILGPLDKLKDIFQSTEPFDEANLEVAIRDFSEESGLSGSKIIHPLRVALTGKSVGPGIFETIVLVGRERAIQRLDKAKQMAE